MDKCPKNMTLVALNIFGLITILDFFQDTFVSIFKGNKKFKETRNWIFIYIHYIFIIYTTFKG